MNIFLEFLAMQYNNGVELGNNNNIHADILIKAIQLFELHLDTLFFLEFSLLLV